MARFSWILQIVIAGVFAVVGAAAGAYLTTKAPVLVYESFPPAQVPTDTSYVGIYNVRLDNIGNKEATDVRVYFALAAGGEIEHVDVKPSLALIDYNKEIRDTHIQQVTFPLLNAGEGAQFSLLGRQGAAGPLTVEVRANGSSGRERRSDDGTSISGSMSALSWFAAVTIGILLFLGLAIALRDSRLFLQRMFSQQLRALRTQAAPSGKASVSDEKLKAILTSATFRFYFNPSVSLNKNKLMRFDASGRILQGNNKNEDTWRIRDGVFEYINSRGGVQSRFYYSPSDGCFYQIPDQDTTAVSVMGIGDQYFMPVTQDVAARAPTA